ncbi:MAG: hypothetical protein ABGW49_05985 [Nitrosopumilus sp.]|jgi:hypothetical protein
MAFCTGCNVSLGWKKYNFQKQWRIQGYFCKSCMKNLGQDFDDNGKVTLPKRACDSCKQEFYFLTTKWQNKQRHRCCNVCKDLTVIDPDSDPVLPPIPSRIPIMMAIFAGFGVLLMIAGLAYVMVVAPQQDSSILHVIIGSCMTGAGFMLARKMVKVRNIVLGKTDVPLDSLR